MAVSLQHLIVSVGLKYIVEEGVVPHNYSSELLQFSRRGHAESHTLYWRYCLVFLDIILGTLPHPSG